VPPFELSLASWAACDACRLARYADVGLPPSACAPAGAATSALTERPSVAAEVGRDRPDCVSSSPATEAAAEGLLPSDSARILLRRSL